MCNVDCFQWAAKNLKREEVFGKRVIEVGSYNVNGSLRSLVEMLEPLEYVGVDIISGPGVDIICPAERLVEKFGKDHFDLVISTCTLEHVRDWRSSVSNMKQICKSNGLILLIVPSRWPFHEHPFDFWRYSEKDICLIFSDCEIITISQDSNKRSLVYAKIKKPEDFIEKDLSDITLYSIIINKRVKNIVPDDLKSFQFKYLVFKSQFLKLLIKIWQLIFWR